LLRGGAHLLSGCRAAIVGIAGVALAAEERALFLERPPAGFILFKRNCAEPAQLRALTAELKALFPERWVPILVDQEGGRVQRLTAPCWPAVPALRRVGELAERDMAAGEAAARLHATAIAAMLTSAGLDVVCAPCLDLLRPETTSAIGDRALASDPAMVGALGRVYAQTLLAHGVVPVIKHLPGHGRATIDSHLDLPRVEATRGDLEASDFLAFGPLVGPPLGQQILAMTAHIVFRAIDPDRPATQSPIVIEEVIRGTIGYRGLLLSDDLSMEALAGPIETRALASLEAGCDLALHCNGKLEELVAVLHCVPDLDAARLERLQALAPAGSLAVAALDDVLAELDWRLGHGVVGV
jgi:beta-N-acetylhexosaminidase